MDEFITPPNSFSLPPKRKAVEASNSAAGTSFTEETAAKRPVSQDEIPEDLKEEYEKFLAAQEKDKADEDGLYKEDVASFTDLHLLNILSAEYVDPFTVPVSHLLEQSREQAKISSAQPFELDNDLDEK